MLGADWIVIANGLEGTSVDLDNAHRAFKAHSTLAARFSPLAFDRDDNAPFVYQNDMQVEKPCMWWRVLIGERMGPPIEVRRLAGS